MNMNAYQGKKSKNENLTGYKPGFQGVPIVAQWLTNPTNIHEAAGSIPGLQTSTCCRCGQKKKNHTRKQIAFIGW